MKRERGVEEWRPPKGVGRGGERRFEDRISGSDNRAEFETKRLFYRGMFLERLLPLF